MTMNQQLNFHNGDVTDEKDGSSNVFLQSASSSCQKKCRKANTINVRRVYMQLFKNKVSLIRALTLL